MADLDLDALEAAQRHLRLRGHVFPDGAVEAVARGQVTHYVDGYGQQRVMMARTRTLIRAALRAARGVAPPRQVHHVREPAGPA